MSGEDEPVFCRCEVEVGDNPDCPRDHEADGPYGNGIPPGSMDVPNRQASMPIRTRARFAAWSAYLAPDTIGDHYDPPAWPKLIAEWPPVKEPK